MCWYLFRMYRFRTGCNLFIWCQIRKLIVISVPQLGLCPWGTADVTICWLLRGLRVLMKAFKRCCWVMRWISSPRKSGLGEMPCRNNLKIKHATLLNFRCDTRDRKGVESQFWKDSHTRLWNQEWTWRQKLWFWTRRMRDYRGLNKSLLSAK